MPDVIFTDEQAALAPQLFAERFGPSVFTTILATHGQICLWPRHYARLKHHCAHLGYRLPKESELLDVISPFLLDACEKYKVRILIARTHHGVSIEKYPPPPANIYQGVQVYFSQICVDKQWRIFKSTNRKPYELALQEARAHNCFEAILLDEHNQVIDGARTSLLIYDGKTTFTCPQGGIDSVMRQEVCSLLKKNGFAVKQSHVHKNHLEGQLLLLCNSLLGVVPVGNAQHPVVSDLCDLFPNHRTGKRRAGKLKFDGGLG